MNHYEIIMETKSVHSRCCNCGIRCYIRKLLLVAELTDNHQKILQQWLHHHHQVPIDEKRICAECFSKLQRCETVDNPPRAVGHEKICIGCGQSLRSKRHHVETSEENLSLLKPEYKQYQHFKTGQYLFCRNCYWRLITSKKDLLNSKKVSKAHTDQECMNKPELKVSDISSDIKNKPELLDNTNVTKFKGDFLLLRGYKRPYVRKGKCLIPKCSAPAQLLSQAQRKLLFLQTDTLLLRRTALCKRHRQFNNSQRMGVNHFSKTAIEEAIHMCEKPVSTIDFDRVQEMPEYLCKYWTGLTPEQFKSLYQKLNFDTSHFQSLRNALAVHLLRQKTGDSILKLANLFLMSTSTLSRQLLLVEKSFETYNSNLENKKVTPTNS